MADPQGSIPVWFTISPWKKQAFRPHFKIRIGSFHPLMTFVRDFRIGGLGVGLLVLGWLSMTVPAAMAGHKGTEAHPASTENEQEPESGHSIAGVSFQIFLHQGKETGDQDRLTKAQADEALQTVVQAFRRMVEDRANYQRFDEALTNNMLQAVIIEPRVVNREGKEFSFLVARTQQKGQVKLLINASALLEQGYLHHPEKLVTALAREFQWVVSKADTAPKRRTVPTERDLANAPIAGNKEIMNMSGEDREHLLQALFDTYLTTMDEFHSLRNQSAYEVGTTTLIPPAQPDSTSTLYDIRVRDALQLIVRDPYFREHTPKAVRSLLNGKIWNVSFADIQSRDWATRTRVVPEDQAIRVGAEGRTIQPAKVLLNIHRPAAPEDPFFSGTNGLPMGALSTEQLARVIAREIQNNITEKSMRGHVAEDERTAPR